MIKQAIEFYSFLAEKLPGKIELVSYGFFIDDEWARLIVNGSSRVIISVNAATKETHERVNRKSNFIRVVNNIKKLIDLKHQYNSNVEICYKYTITSENIHEIPDAIKIAEDLGCDSIKYGYEISVVNILGQNNELKEQLKGKIAQYRNSELKLVVERAGLNDLGLT